MLLLHVGLATLGYPLAFFLRFDFGLSVSEWRWLAGTLPLLVILKALAFWWFHIYDAMWRYLGMRDILAITKAGTLASVVFSAVVLTGSSGTFPKTVLILEWLLGLALVGGARVACRAVWEWSGNGYSAGKRALVVGAGDAAEMLVRDIERNRQLLEGCIPDQLAIG